MCVGGALLVGALRFSTLPTWAASSPACAGLPPTLAPSRGQGAGPGAQGRGCGGRSLLPELPSSRHLLPRPGLFGALPPSSHRNAVVLVAFPTPHILTGGIIAWHGLHIPRGLIGSPKGKLPFSPACRFPSGCLRVAFSCFIAAGRVLGGTVPSTGCWALYKITSPVGSALRLYPLCPHLPPLPASSAQLCFVSAPPLCLCFHRVLLGLAKSCVSDFIQLDGRPGQPASQPQSEPAAAPRRSGAPLGAVVPHSAWTLGALGDFLKNSDAPRKLKSEFLDMERLLKNLPG